VRCTNKPPTEVCWNLAAGVPKEPGLPLEPHLSSDSPVDSFLSSTSSCLRTALMHHEVSWAAHRRSCPGCAEAVAQCCSETAYAKSADRMGSLVSL